jgi:hypothetical protein
VRKITEKTDVPEKIQEIGKKLGEYKDSLATQFKDMEIEVKNWNFAVRKTETEYTVGINLNLAIRPKKK